jgi:3-hydroxyisobutyrate dehydrogenase
MTGFLRGRMLLMRIEKIGFIGLGIMGIPMAKNLAKAGFELVVWNRTTARASEFEADVPGTIVASSPADVAARTSVIITMVTDSSDVADVVSGEKGIISGIKPGSIVIDMSTISPAVERELSEKLEEKDCSLIDAPVSGGDIGAKAGTLAIMAGGRQDVFEKVLPVFEAMGKTITYCGPVGSGQLAKQCNQILVSVNLLGTCEAIAFADNNGLDPDVMISAISGGAAGSWQLSNLGPKIIRGDYEPGFMINLIQKDLKLVLETANASSSPVPTASMVHQLFNGAQGKGLGAKGTQALFEVIAGRE